MNVFIIATQTADGFIAENSDHFTAWSSKEDKKRFVEMTKAAGVVVMGSNTFKTLPHPLKDRLNIVYTRSPEKFSALNSTASAEGVEATNIAPADLIKNLAARGYTSVAICGGAEIYTLFMKSGVVSKLYLTIEPIVFGSGISLFSEPIKEKLILKDSKTLESGTIFLDYDVAKEA